jgi:hypothetical protein
MAVPRSTLVAGGAFAAAVLAQLVAFPSNADSSSPPAAIAGHYLHHGGTDVASDYLSLVATPLLVVLLCGLAAQLPSTSRRVVLSALSVAAGLEVTATGIELALSTAVASTAPAATTGALFQVASRFFFLSLLWLGIAVGGIAAGAPAARWLKALGGGAAMVLVGAGAATAHPHGPLGVLVLPAEVLLLAWVVAQVVTGLRRRQPAPVSARA